ncbi:MAG: glycosyltransferase family 4 protein [Planctomycetes bacterium]|nr:glycosyltransferase family 4 protein [Planctomycetota bacterium]
MIKKDAPITVVHIITRLILGGAQENTILTVEGLQTRPEYKVVLISGPALGPEGELIKRVKDSGVELIIVPELRRNINPFLEIIAFIKLLILMRRLKPDIVHTHSAKAGILGRWAAFLSGVKIIVHTLHGLSFYPYQNKLVNFLYILAEKTASWVTSKFISVADAMTAQSLKAGIGTPEKYTTIYSALELDKFKVTESQETVRRRLGLESRHKVVGTIARLFPLKGHEYVLQIAVRIIRAVPEVKFLFVGDGSLSGRIKREINGRGLEDWFVFTGLVPPDRIPSMIQAIDILVHPSLREGLARTIPQSFSLGKPVVSFDVDGARELVISSQTGFLIPAPVSAKQTKESLDQMAQAIIFLLKNPDQARQMGANGQKLIFPNFDARHMVGKIIEQYVDPAHK